MAFGGLNESPESKESRALTSIDSGRYPDTNVDLQKNIARLNANQDYMAQYMRTMQQGIDQANQNFIEQIQSLIANFVVLFAGGTPTGIDLGDLRYILPAIGALFGFGEGPFPINLLNAAQHFFLGYIVPLPQFTDVIADAVIGWAEELGFSDSAIQALKDFNDAITELGGDVGDMITKIFGIFDIFGIFNQGADLSPIGELWNTLFDLFDAAQGSFKPITEALETIGLPIIEQLTNIVEWINSIVDAFSNGTNDIQGILNFANVFQSVDFTNNDSPFDLQQAIIDIGESLFRPLNIPEEITDYIEGLITPSSGFPFELPLDFNSGEQRPLTDWFGQLWSMLRGANIGGSSVGFNPESSWEQLVVSVPALKQARDAIQSAFNAYVNQIVYGGRVPLGHSSLDFDAASKATANAIATMSAQVQAIINNQQSSGLNGQSKIINFADYSNASSMPSGWQSIYSGPGTASVIIRDGRAAMTLPNDGMRSCISVYDILITATDYQAVGAIFASTPQGIFDTARNRIVARCNVAGTSYVAADFGPGTLSLACVVDGVLTTMVQPIGHQFTPNVPYWLYTGTVGGIRVFEVRQGSRTILTHTEVGTTSRYGSEYRCGGAYWYTPSGNMPAEMATWVICDNAPSAVLGSGATMVRTNGSGATMYDGFNVIEPNFFDTLQENTADITCNLSDGSFTPGADDWYTFNATVLVGGNWPNRALLLLARTPVGSDAVAPYRLGQDNGRTLNAVGAAVLRRTVSESWSVYCRAGEKFQLGYGAETTSFNAITGDPSGAATYWTITRGKSRA